LRRKSKVFEPERKRWAELVTINDQLVLIAGESATGKSASLATLRNQERVLDLNCEAGKRKPFKNKFKEIKITDPYDVLAALDMVAPGGLQEKNFDTIVIDTMTFLMDMFESQYVVGAANTMQGWANYGQFFKQLMQEKISKLNQSVLVLAHTRSDLDEKAMEMKTAVPIKGALKNNGIEAYFSTVVATKKMTLKDLEPYKSDLLHITPRDELLGFKHVFQTQPTKATTGERIRSPMGLFTVEQTFMDNDAQLLLDHLHTYYN